MTMTRIIVNQALGTDSGRLYSVESANVHLVQGQSGSGDEFGLFAIESIADDVTQAGPKVMLKAYGSQNKLLEDMMRIAVAEANGAAYVNLTQFQDAAEFPAE